MDVTHEPGCDERHTPRQRCNVPYEDASREASPQAEPSTYQWEDPAVVARRTQNAIVIVTSVLWLAASYAALIVVAKPGWRDASGQTGGGASVGEFVFFVGVFVLATIATLVAVLNGVRLHRRSRRD